jgi:Tfp pilus assembly protein PilW
MTRSHDTRRHRRQDGFTTVELIVAIAVGVIVTIAIFPIFSLIARVDTIWTGAAQARAAGMTAEGAFEADLRAYPVTVTGANTLVLQGAARAVDLEVSSQPSTTFCVNYQVQPTADSTLPRLVRTVTDMNGNMISSASVAHGVLSFTTSTVGPVQHPTIQVTMTLASIDGPPVAATPLIISLRENLSGWNVQCH